MSARCEFLPQPGRGVAEVAQRRARPARCHRSGTVPSRGRSTSLAAVAGSSAPAPVAAYDRGVSVAVATPTNARSPQVDAAGSQVPAHLRRRLEPVARRDWTSWGAAALGRAHRRHPALRQSRLPARLVFDEVYYANEGQELLDHGVEWRTETDSRRQRHRLPLATSWSTRRWASGSSALGIKMFGYNCRSAGGSWPPSSGCSSILIIDPHRPADVPLDGARLHRRPADGARRHAASCCPGPRSSTSSCMFFIAGRVRLPRSSTATSAAPRWLRRAGERPRSEPHAAGRPAPAALAAVPWWRLAAGRHARRRCGVKWSAVWFIPVFVVLIFFWEVGAPQDGRRRAPVARRAARRGRLDPRHGRASSSVVLPGQLDRLVPQRRRLEAALPARRAAASTSRRSSARCRTCGTTTRTMFSFHDGPDLARTSTSPGRGSG